MGTNMDQRDVTASGTEDTWKLGLEIRNKGDVSKSYSEEESNIATWEASVTFEGVAAGIEDTKAPKDLTYGFHPYVWLEEVKSVTGVSQKFLVLDYWVSRDTAAPAPPEVDVPPQAVPAAPLITSPTHPDPGTWYASSTAAFTWTQPEGDPAIKTYDWRLDQKPDTVPSAVHRGPAATKTYQNLADGAWTMHVRGMNAEGEWGETGHRTIRVDAHAPQVSLAVMPKWPDGDGCWYVSPVTVAVAADDGAGSGVAGMEISTDGVSWQPYITALQFTANTPGATLYARARDAVGNLSVPVSATFKIDRTAPSSHVTGGAGPGVLGRGDRDQCGGERGARPGRRDHRRPLRAATASISRSTAWSGLRTTETGSWHPFTDRPQIEVNWYYTATAPNRRRLSHLHRPGVRRGRQPRARLRDRPGAVAAERQRPS